jgi:hypothetical protein
MIRNFGLIGGLAMMAMLLFPIAHAFTARATRQQRALAVAFFLYLVMCASNPNLFCSLGRMILAVLVANISLIPSPAPGRFDGILDPRPSLFVAP